MKASVSHGKLSFWRKDLRQRGAWADIEIPDAAWADPAISTRDLVERYITPAVAALRQRLAERGEQ